MKFGADIYVPLRMNCNNFGDVVRNVIVINERQKMRLANS